MSEQSTSPKDDDDNVGILRVGEDGSHLSLEKVDKNGDASEENDNASNTADSHDVDKSDVEVSDQNDVFREVCDAKASGDESSITRNADEDEAVIIGNAEQDPTPDVRDSPDVDNEEILFDSPKPPDPVSIETVKQVSITDKEAEACADIQSVTPDARLQKLTSLLLEQKDDLLSSNLNEYRHFDDLVSLFESTGEALADYEQKVGCIHEKLHQVRSLMSEMSAIVEKKLTEEDLHCWLPKPIMSSTPDLDDKKSMVEAAEARLQVAEVHKKLLKAEERQAVIEAEAAEAKREAGLAAEEARRMAKLADETRLALEHKVKAEQDARLQAEEERKKKEQKLRLKAEEAKRKKQNQFAATSSADQLENGEDETNQDALKNWTKYTYKTTPGEIPLPLTCVLRALPGTLPGQKAVSVRCLDQRACAVDLGNNQELVSWIIQLEKNDHFEVLEPLALLMPHVASRNLSYREPVIKRLESDGTWSELDTYEVIIPDLKEFKFVETRLFDIEGTFAVVTRPRREILTIPRRGGKVSPSVDVRICFAFRPMTFRTSTSLEVEIQPVELTLISDLKNRHPIECDNLVASSPIIQFTLAESRLAKPLTITIPVPPNPTKSRRPLTALTDKDIINGKNNTRPVSALSFSRELSSNEDLLYLLILTPGEGWLVSNDIQLIPSKTNDCVSIDLSKPLDNRFLVIRTKPSVRFREAERIGGHIDKATRERTVQIMLRQRSDDPQRVTLHCVSIAKTERYLRKLKEDGYDMGPPASRKIILHEGQKIKLGFRGNIREFSSQDGSNMELVFNTHVATTSQFKVDIIDKFSQKSLDTYRGFCQLFVRGMVPRELSKDEEKAKASQPKGHQKVDLVEGDILLCEMLITLPKPEPEAPKRIVNRAPIEFKADDVLDNDYLRHLSSVIGDEWRTLAQHLGIRRMRIQAILRNNVTMENDAVIYEMLATWAKRMPRSVNKVELLCRALASAGRVDLAEEVRDKQNEKHQEKMKSSREAYLRKAFIKIAQRLPIMNEWRRLAKGLGLRSDVINRIDDKDAGIREKVTRCLNMWLDKAGEKANVILLLNVLRKCHWPGIASEIQSELGVY